MSTERQRPSLRRLVRNFTSLHKAAFAVNRLNNNVTGNGDMMSQPDLLDVLQTRREYCRAMLELSREQHSIIEDERYSELLQIVAKKQRVLEGLHSLSQEFGGLTDYWKSIRSTLPPDVMNRCAAALAEAESLLANTLLEENRGTAALASRRDHMQRQLLALGEEVSLRSSYSPSEPQFLDVSR